MSQEHGDAAYRKGCRCTVCRAANAERRRMGRYAAQAKGIPPHKHGTASGYDNYACRCVLCRDANAARQAAVRARRKAPERARQGAVSG